MAGPTRAREAERLWAATDRLLAGATLPGILAHKLGPLAAHRLRRLGEAVRDPLAQEERSASIALLSAVPLLQRIRASSDAPLVLIKGPEIASRYPGRARRFGDVDLLTSDPEGVHRALVGAGFVEFVDPEFEPTIEHHHLQPLAWPTISLLVEIHRHPNWPLHVHPPSFEEIVEAASDSSLGIDGVTAPSPLHHALIMSAHAWQHEPFLTLRSLLDVAALAVETDGRELDETAGAWGIGRIWRTTRRTIDALFYGGRKTVPLRSWARHLESVRERTIFERHLSLLVHGFWGLPPGPALAQTWEQLLYLARPGTDETWREKLGRARRGVANPGAPARPPATPREPD